jgi:hypothetical protein
MNWRVASPRKAGLAMTVQIIGLVNGQKPMLSEGTVIARSEATKQSASIKPK